MNKLITAAILMGIVFNAHAATDLECINQSIKSNSATILALTYRATGERDKMNQYGSMARESYAFTQENCVGRVYGKEVSTEKYNEWKMIAAIFHKVNSAAQAGTYTATDAREFLDGFAKILAKRGWILQ